MASEPTTEPTDERPQGDELHDSDEVRESDERSALQEVDPASSEDATDETQDEPASTRRGSKKGRAATKKAARSPRARSTGRSRTAKKQADLVDPSVPGDDSLEQDPDVGPVDQVLPTVEESAPQPAEDQGGVDDQEGADDAPGTDTTASTVPSFGLIFQAPEPVAPRRRRATSAAGAPSRSEPDAGGRADREPTPTDDDTDEPREDTPSGEGDTEDGAGSRRSRRRGGRGRRGARGTDAESADDSGGGTSDAEGARAESRTSSERSGRAAKRASKDAGTSGSEDRAASEAEVDPAVGESDSDEAASDAGSRRRRRRRRGGSDTDTDETRGAKARDEVTGLKGSTRLEAKKQRRREGREAGRRRQIITEAEFLARRESVERVMVVREKAGKTQIGVLEDGVLVEHYVSRETGASMIGNVYLGRVQNVLPSMEAAFVDIGKGRNAVLYAGEVNWDAAGLEGSMPKRIENALTSGDTVLVQVTKDPIGHKGARLTSQISLPGRFLVYVPEASMTGISRKLPDTERARLKSILKKIVPDDAGVIVRTAAEGASEEELTADIERLTHAWERIRTKAEKSAKKKGTAGAPVLLHGEPDLTVKVIRDVFNEDFSELVVAGDKAWAEVSDYLGDVAPDLAKRLSKWTAETDVFASHRVEEQLAKALDRKVWLPSGGSLVIDRTEAMTVVDVNTGKFVGSGGNLEETVTKNNIEAAEEIVRQLRLRDIGGIIVIDFIDMVLESNRDLVVRRLLECLGRDRTKHQVAEVTSLGLVQMTRKRVGSGLLEVFSEPCTHCSGRGVVVHADPVDPPTQDESAAGGRGRGRGRGGNGSGQGSPGRSGRGESQEPARPQPTGPTAAQIAAAAHAAALKAAAAVSSDEESQSPSDAERVSAIATEVAEADTAQELSGAAPEDGEPVTLTAASETTDDGRPATDGFTEVVETVQTADSHSADVPEPVTVPLMVSEPASSRPRRRRGRVVAQAGPPGHSEVRVLPVDTDGASEQPDTGRAPD